MLDAGGYLVAAGEGHAAGNETREMKIAAEIGAMKPAPSEQRGMYAHVQMKPRPGAESPGRTARQEYAVLIAPVERPQGRFPAKPGLRFPPAQKSALDMVLAAAPVLGHGADTGRGRPTRMNHRQRGDRKAEPRQDPGREAAATGRARPCG